MQIPHIIKLNFLREYGLVAVPIRVLRRRLGISVRHSPWKKKKKGPTGDDKFGAESHLTPLRKLTVCRYKKQILSISRIILFAIAHILFIWSVRYLVTKTYLFHHTEHPLRPSVNFWNVFNSRPINPPKPSGINVHPALHNRTPKNVLESPTRCLPLPKPLCNVQLQHIPYQPQPFRWYKQNFQTSHQQRQ